MTTNKMSAHDLVVSEDRPQLPMFYPDAEHYIYHDPQVYQQSYAAGAQAMREMDLQGVSAPTNMRGTMSDPTPVVVAPPQTQQPTLPSAALPTIQTKPPRSDGLQPWVMTILGALAVFGLVFLLQKLWRV